MASTATDIRDRLRGVAVGLLTPFDDELAIAHESLRENAEILYERGMRTFLAAANISEYHSLSRDERVSLVETSVDALPSDACVLAGVGGSIGDARELIQAYDAIGDHESGANEDSADETTPDEFGIDRSGVDALMIMPPDHTYVHEAGLLQYYRELAAVTDTPLVPYVRGFDPSVDFLAALTRIEGVVGIKYALEDPVKLGAAVEGGADDVVWVDGAAEPYAVSFWAEGAEGFSAGVSNFRPAVGLELFDALSSGDWERARALRNCCLPFQRFRGETGTDNAIPGAVSVPAVKSGLELAGLHGGRVRPPLVELSPEDERRVEALYLQLEDDIDRIIE